MYQYLPYVCSLTCNCSYDCRHQPEVSRQCVTYLSIITCIISYVIWNGHDYRRTFVLYVGTFVSYPVLSPTSTTPAPCNLKLGPRVQPVSLCSLPKVCSTATDPVIWTVAVNHRDSTMSTLVPHRLVLMPVRSSLLLRAGRVSVFASALGYFSF